MLWELIGRILFIVPKLPKTAQVCITNKCNFNCQMCQRFDLQVPIKEMALEDFKIIVSKLKGVKSIILTGWGEPLLHPNLIEMIKICKEKKLAVRFTTNGSLLNEEKAQQLIDSGLDAITFSVDEVKPKENSIGHEVKSQLENIIQLQRMIKNQNSGLEIYLQSVFQENNKKDLLEVADFATQNKLSRIRISRLDTRFHDFKRPGIKHEKQLIKDLEKQVKGSKVGIDFLPHTAFDGIFKSAYKILRLLLHRCGIYCLRTYNDVYVNVNGYATPCCALPHLKMGSLLKMDLGEIWNSEKFKHFRKNQNIYCGKCDVLHPRPHKRS